MDKLQGDVKTSPFTYAINIEKIILRHMELRLS